MVTIEQLDANNAVRVIEGSLHATVRMAIGAHYFESGRAILAQGKTRFGVEYADGRVFWFDADQLEQVSE